MRRMDVTFVQQFVVEAKRFIRGEVDMNHVVGWARENSLLDGLMPYPQPVGSVDDAYARWGLLVCEFERGHRQEGDVRRALNEVLVRAARSK